MLVGQYQSKLTDKDRIAVPKKIRDELGEDLVIAKWYEKCLVLVSLAKWKDLEKRLTGEKNFVISPVRNIDRFILGSAFEIKLDNQGRFILHEALKSYANIENEVIFVGLGDRAEIWEKEKWIEIESGAEKRASEAIESLANKP